MLFRDTPVDRLAPNRLVLHIQPDEGISLRFGAKIPGTLLKLGAVNMDFAYADYFGSTPSTGYERLLYDCMIGDATLFQRADMVEAGWAVVDADPGRLAGGPAADLPQLRRRLLGPEGGGGADAARRAPLAGQPGLRRTGPAGPAGRAGPAGHPGILAT